MLWYNEILRETIYDFRFCHITSIQVDAEDTGFSEKRQVLGYEGVSVVKDGATQIAWGDKDAAKMYWIYSDVMTEAEIVTIAEEIAAQLLN